MKLLIVCQKVNKNDPLGDVEYVEYWEKPCEDSEGQFVQWVAGERVHEDVNPYCWEMPNGDYTGLDDQFVVDSKNLAVDYKDGVATSSHPDFTSAVSVDGGSWSVEVSMSVAAVGLGQVAANQHIGFDLDFVDGDGTKQNYQLIWYLAAHSTCSCASCCCNSSPSVDLPYCDVLRFGALDLSP